MKPERPVKVGTNEWTYRGHRILRDRLGDYVFRDPTPRPEARYPYEIRRRYARTLALAAAAIDEMEARK